jgi:beta-N-acetylhexosaminidase
MMTAHIRYTARDMLNPATQSAAIVADILRAPDAIGFANLLITDDLAMGALRGTPGERATAALQAGCDIALHCSGVLEETRDLLAALPPVSARAAGAMARAAAQAAVALEPLDEMALAAERDGLLS